MSGALILLASWWVTQQLEARLAERQDRVENLRFVRDVSTREKGPMPFFNLDLEGMNLSGLRLGCRDEEMVEECFHRADFEGAKLASADLSRMELDWANFRGADLRNVNFSDSNLNGAILIDADMTGAKIDQVCYDNLTRWPEGVAPPKDQYGCDRGL